MSHPAPSGAPSTIVGISFPDVFRAQEFLTAAMRLSANKSIELRDAVTILKTADGRTVVKETVDPQPLQTAMSGAVWSGLIGLLLAGPIGWVAGTALGAGTGAITAKVVDLGVPDAWVDWFRDAVQPGTATVVLLLGHFDEATTLAELHRFAGGHLVHANLDPRRIERIRAALDDSEIAPADSPSDTPPSTADTSAG